MNIAVVVQLVVVDVNVVMVSRIRARTLDRFREEVTVEREAILRRNLRENLQLAHILKTKADHTMSKASLRLACASFLRDEAFRQLWRQFQWFTRLGLRV